ncbi:MAG: CoB--CoM heterodisulfide reductase iron-sulfur subunit B family protein [Desulfobacteraceae bacterium]|jgi:heterodisulfide reductase subunit B|nr:CoB--CoM heterodisulfide reductase iron-sulfur subunit B family protein [Desulfobacteraceae bacterium]
MNQYALFLGCNIPVRVKQYDVSARMVLKELGVSLKDIRQFNCCGYPMRNMDPKAFLLSAVRNLALAEKAELDMLVLCQCCFGSLKKAEVLMAEEGDLQKEVRLLLADEGLEYNGNVKIKHFLSVLYHDVGLDAIKQKIAMPYKKLNIATHYGCHVLRPSRVTEFDDPVSPTLIDDLVKVTGAKSVDWPLKLECCGAPVTGIDDDLSWNLTEKKLNDAKAAGAHYVCTACPYCHIQFDTVQQKMLLNNKKQDALLPAILYPQLLGLAMGLDGALLGISDNEIDISDVISFLNEE